MLLRPLDGILGSQSKVALLRVLFRASAPLSAREAARAAGMAHSGALRSLADLVELGIVARTETPGQHLYVINQRNLFVELCLARLFEVERGRVGEVFRLINEVLRPFLANARVRSAVIYGSAARGDDRPGSDLDLLVVTRTQDDVADAHPHLVEASPTLFDRFGLELSPVVISVDQLLRQADAGDGVIDAVIRDGRQDAGVSIEHLLDLPHRKAECA